MKIRNRNSKLFIKLFKNKSWCKIQKQEPNAQSSWYGFNIVLTGNLKNKREEIIRKLIKNKIEVRPTMTGNFLNNPVMKFLDYEAKGTLRMLNL